MVRLEPTEAVVETGERRARLGSETIASSGLELKVGCCKSSPVGGEYCRYFSMAELQQTFYQPPQLATAIRWRESVPPSFEFTLKAWQFITHEPSSPTYRRLKKPIPDKAKRHYGSFKPTEEVFAAWEATAAIASALWTKVIVFQTPPSFNPTFQHRANLWKFFSSIDRKGWLLGWEPRGEWEPKVVRKLCEELDLIHVVNPLNEEPLYGAIRYFRLNGQTGYLYFHTNENLVRLRSLCSPGMTTYVLFNNLFRREDALRFLELIQGSPSDFTGNGSTLLDAAVA